MAIRAMPWYQHGGKKKLKPLQYRWKAEDVSFLHVLLVWGVKLSHLLNKPIGASPRHDKDGTILACSTYSTYTVRIGIKKGGERSAGYG
jgi:hypothetical protein